MLDIALSSWQQQRRIAQSVSWPVIEIGTLLTPEELARQIEQELANQSEITLVARQVEAAARLAGSNPNELLLRPPTVSVEPIALAANDTEYDWSTPSNSGQSFFTGRTAEEITSTWVPPTEQSAPNVAEPVTAATEPAAKPIREAEQAEITYDWSKAWNEPALNDQDLATQDSSLNVSIEASTPLKNGAPVSSETAKKVDTSKVSRSDAWVPPTAAPQPVIPPQPASIYQQPLVNQMPLGPSQPPYAAPSFTQQASPSASASRTTSRLSGVGKNFHGWLRSNDKPTSRIGPEIPEISYRYVRPGNSPATRRY